MGAELALGLRFDCTKLEILMATFQMMSFYEQFVLHSVGRIDWSTYGPAWQDCFAQNETIACLSDDRLLVFWHGRALIDGEGIRDVSR